MTGVRDSAPWPGPVAGSLPADPEGGGEGGGAQLRPGLPHPRAGGPQRVLEIRGRPHHAHLQRDCRGEIRLRTRYLLKISLSSGLFSRIL